MAVIAQKQAANVNRVGNSYGERRNIQQGVPQAPQRPVVQQQLDQFGGTVGNKQEEVRHAPNAVFGGNWARVTSDTPFKKPIHDSLERGRQKPQAGNRPSDTAILNFLNRVITTTPAAATAAHKATVAKAQGVAPKAAVAAPRVAAAPAARPQARPAVPAAQAPIRRMAPQAPVAPYPTAAPIAAQRFAARAPVVRQQIRKA